MIKFILKYASSHRYELHALAAGTLAFLLMFPLKLPVKKWIQSYVEARAEKSLRWDENREQYRRRLGLILIFLDLVLSGALFTLLSVLSPLIRFSLSAACLSGILSLTEYALYDQLRGSRKKAEHA